MNNEQALIEFFNSFDLFCNGFFNTMQKLEAIPELIAIPNSTLKSRNISGTFNSLTSFTTYKTKTGIFGHLDCSILAECLFFFLDLPDI